ncbi:outer membrane murein-binding lipoprotein Lpp [Rhodoligotrophos appendicifer]|nr:hypothetical protein [Rhodoligotrophos appendicifer]
MKILAVITVMLLLAGCESMKPNAGVRGDSDLMGGQAGVGIAL